MFWNDFVMEIIEEEEAFTSSSLSLTCSSWSCSMPPGVWTMFIEHVCRRWFLHICISFGLIWITLIWITLIISIILILIILLIAQLIIFGASGWGRVSYGSAVWDTKGSRLTGLSHTGGRRRVSNTEHCTLAYRTLESTGGRRRRIPAHYTLHYIRGSPIDSQRDCTRLHWTAQAKETPMLLFQHCIARQRLHCFSIHWASSLWGLEQQSTSLWGGEQHSTHPDYIPRGTHSLCNMYNVQNGLGEIFNSKIITRPLVLQCKACEFSSTLWFWAQLQPKEHFWGPHECPKTRRQAPFHCVCIVFQKYCKLFGEVHCIALWEDVQREGGAATNSHSWKSRPSWLGWRKKRKWKTEKRKWKFPSCAEDAKALSPKQMNEWYIR